MNNLAQLNFTNRFADLNEVFFTRQPPQAMPSPYLIDVSPECANLLDIDLAKVSEQEWAELFSGNLVLPNSSPLAQIYSGHQFGSYNPQLGDGRGLLLGEVETSSGHWELHLKGAGMTPYSRMGDGRAVLRSSIREYLVSETMAGLGIPTTRALGIAGSDLPVYREEVETAAMVLRVANTHIRFGHFEYFFHTKQFDHLEELMDFCLDHYFQECKRQDKTASLANMLKTICEKTAEMIAAWQVYGFCHGVMNTDNMSIIGDSFDYGPYAFLDDYDPNYICNHSDHSGRYAFNQQPGIGLWNLNAFAHSFTHVLEREHIIECLSAYEPTLHNRFRELMLARIGLQNEKDGDALLVSDMLDFMEKHQVDFALFFRRLSNINSSDVVVHQELHALEDYQKWRERYWLRLQEERRTYEERKAAMNAVNPKYTLRNYLAQQAIDKAKQKDFSEVRLLRKILSRPFADWPEHESYAAPSPDWGKNMCISCSS